MTASRRSRHDQGPGVSLFPFLAVLLCTMGMLIMLLVLIGRDTADREMAENSSSAPVDRLFSQEAFDELAGESPKIPDSPPSETAQADDESAKSAESAGKEETQKLSQEDEQLYDEYLRLYGEMTPEEIQSQRESAEWFLSELQGVRDRTQQELTEQRQKLAESDAEIGRQVQQLIELNARVADLKKLGDDENAEALQSEIDAKAEEIAQLNTQIEELRQKEEAEGQKPTYAILPYRGKSGTFRHPIYIECDGDGIRLMPERVQFLPEDFLVAKYPGNPFDAGIRAARQYFIDKGEGSNENEPYPLLILKPESAQQYYIAKEALASWGGEFGYEFVESDANIEYPKPDPELKRRVEEQVALARARIAGPLAAILNELEAKGINAEFPEDEPAGTGMGIGGGTGEGAGGNQLASQLGPYAKLEETSGSSESPVIPFDSGYTPPQSENYSSAPAYGSYAAAGGSDTQSSGLTDFDESEILQETPAASLSLPHSETPESSGGEDSAVYAQGDTPYSAEGNTDTITPFAQITPKTDEESGQEGVQIDPRETVGNTSYLSGTSGSSTPPEDAENPSLPEMKKEQEDPKEKKEPKVQANRDKREINLADELRKPSQMAIERPVTIICSPEGYLFPAQPGIRNAKAVSQNDQEILETVVSCVRSWKAAGKNMYWSPWIRIKVNQGGESNGKHLAELMKSQNVRVDWIEE